MIGRALVERRSTLRQPDQVLVDALTGGATYAGPTVNSSTALAHVDVFACVRVLAQSVGALPLIVYRRTASGRERADDARIARLLAAPMPGVTQGGLFANATAHLQLWGNAYVAKYRDASGAVSQLGLLDPSQMMVEVRGGEPFYRYARIEGEMSRRDILHVKGFSVDGVYGVSPIGQARQTLGLGLALEEHAARFFSNGAHPSGVIQMPVSPTEEQIKRFRESWDAMHSGTSRAHRPAILVGGASWQPIGMPPEDAQFVEQRKLSTTQVCRVFGVYPWMVFGDSGDSLTYANVEQQQIAFVTHSLRPWLVTIEQALQADDDLFGSAATGLYPEFLIDALLRGDAATRAAVYAAATGGKPWMTRNEVRRAENLPGPPIIKGASNASTSGAFSAIRSDAHSSKLWSRAPKRPGSDQRAPYHVKKAGRPSSPTSHAAPEVVPQSMARTRIRLSRREEDRAMASLDERDRMPSQSDRDRSQSR